MKFAYDLLCRSTHGARRISGSRLSLLILRDWSRRVLGERLVRLVRRRREVRESERRQGAPQIGAHQLTQDSPT